MGCAYSAPIFSAKNSHTKALTAICPYNESCENDDNSKNNSKETLKAKERLKRLYGF